MGICTIEVTVQGFPPVQKSHVSAGAAFAAVWEDYRSYDDLCSFRKFMSIARRRSVPNPSGVGEKILVCGKPALALEPEGHTRAFVYEGERNIMRAHHAEIQPVTQ